MAKAGSELFKTPLPPQKRWEGDDERAGGGQDSPWMLLKSRADYRPEFYGKEPPDVKGRRDVYIPNFEYTREELLAMAELIEGLVSGGRAASEFRDFTVSRLVEQPSRIELGPLSVIAVNSPVFQSEIGEALLTRWPNEMLAAVYHDDPGSNKISVSLRSHKGGVHVGEIAQVFGGGGHQAAAGLQLDAVVRTSGAAVKAVEATETSNLIAN